MVNDSGWLLGWFISHGGIIWRSDGTYKIWSWEPSHQLATMGSWLRHDPIGVTQPSWPSLWPYGMGAPKQHQHALGQQWTAVFEWPSICAPHTATWNLSHLSRQDTKWRFSSLLTWKQILFISLACLFLTASSDRGCGAFLETHELQDPISESCSAWGKRAVFKEEKWRFQQNHRAPSLRPWTTPHLLAKAHSICRWKPSRRKRDAAAGKKVIVTNKNQQPAM